ncbi:hypothetical protein DRQ50_11945 [bacterium]|nr:MAG: hypothetical protein DRQ50_11945 [bacterium]
MKGTLMTRNILWAGLALAAVVCGSAGAQQTSPLQFFQPDLEAPPVALTVHFAATGETRAIAGRELLAGSREMYLRSATVATLLNAGRFWDSGMRRLELKVGQVGFTVTADSRLVTTSEGQTLLPVPVLDNRGDLWLPLTLLVDVVGPALGDRLRWDAQTRRLTLGVPEYTVLRLRSEILGRATAVHIHCRDPLGYRTESPQPGVIELKIYGGDVNAAAVGQTRRRGLLLSARSRQQRDDAVITFRVDDLVSRYRTYTADEGREIVLVLEEEQIASMPAPVPRGRAQVNIDAAPRDITHVEELRTVVIDPGHGGHDVGAVGPHGILEKDVNLAVARELRSWLKRESDLEVVLTRERDEHQDLAARAEAANLADGDLFISLHCNSWFNDSAHGLETYFLSPAQSDWAKSVEAAENAAGGGAPADDVEFIVWELVQNRFISASSHLAETIQAQVTSDLDVPDRGVRQAGFRVLVGAYMPAVLVEMGFVSHAGEERRLGDRRYQQRLAASLGRAVLAYREATALVEVEADDGEEDHGGWE